MGAKLQVIGIVRTVGSPCRCGEAISEGLAALGLVARLFDSERIDWEAATIARTCDVVFDHTDTFLGRGLLRAFVRMLLEVHEAGVVGSDARACALCDDKPAAKGRLRSIGVAVPEGPAVPGTAAGLDPPLVFKAAHEHMSRGLFLARTRDETAAEAERRVQEGAAPFLVERFVAGRELGVSVLDDRVLPIVEWKLDDPDRVLDAAGKLAAEGPSRMVRADLDAGTRARVEADALCAFRALGLRDYARFDVRLAANGTPYFLEANTKPSMEREEAFPLSASWAGIDYPALLDRLLRLASSRRECTHRFPPGTV